MPAESLEQYEEAGGRPFDTAKADAARAAQQGPQAAQAVLPGQPPPGEPQPSEPSADAYRALGFNPAEVAPPTAQGQQPQQPPPQVDSPPLDPNDPMSVMRPPQPDTPSQPQLDAAASDAAQKSTQEGQQKVEDYSGVIQKHAEDAYDAVLTAARADSTTIDNIISSIKRIRTFTIITTGSIKGSSCNCSIISIC